VKLKTTLVLLVVFAVLLALVLYFDSRGEKKEAAKETTNTLISLVSGDIRKVSLVRDGETLAFEREVTAAYGPGSDRVLEAIDTFIHSLPLAGRTPHRVFLSHSLPGPRDLPTFDVTVLARTPTAADFAPRGSAHSLVWGRYHTKAALNSLSELLDADYFICGHQPQEMGYDILHERMLILASDHNHGMFLPIDLSKTVTLSTLISNIHPLGAIA